MSKPPSVQGEIPAFAATIVGELLGLVPRRKIRPDFGFVQHLIDYGRNHRLLPLIVERLRTIVLDPDAEELIRGLRDDLARHALMLAAELARLTDRFQSAGIEALPYKGPPLAQRLWGDVALRSMTDLDIVVREKDVFRVHELLLEDGYVPKVLVHPHQQKPFLRYEHDRAYVREHDRLCVEIHWRLFDRYVAFELTEEELWGGEEGVGMIPEVELLVLAVHGAKHAWTSAGWIVDVAAILVRDEPDEHILGQLAKLTGTVRVLNLALALAAAYTGVRLPERFAKGIAADPVVGDLCRETIEGPISRPREQADTFDDARFYLRTRERLSDRLHYRWYWLFTPNIEDQNALRVPPGLSWMNYLVRMYRLIRKKLEGRAP